MATKPSNRAGRWVFLAVLTVLFVSFLDLRGYNLLPTNPLGLLHNWVIRLEPGMFPTIIGGIFGAIFFAAAVIERKAKPFQEPVFLTVGGYLCLVFLVQDGYPIPEISRIPADPTAGSLFLVMWFMMTLGLALLASTLIWSTIKKDFRFWGPRWWEG